MNKLLHIIGSPKSDESLSLAIAREFIKNAKAQVPAIEIDELNLFKLALPALTTEQVEAKGILSAGHDLEGIVKKSWVEIEQQIKRFLAADTYLITTPMWNFSIPYVLKHYIDIIVQPKYLFRYTPNGVEGLAKNKKMYVISTRGGDYSEGSAYRAFDFQEPYLRTIFGFVGITDITFIKAEPLDAGGAKVRAQSMEKAMQQVRALQF